MFIEVITYTNTKRVININEIVTFVADPADEGRTTITFKNDTYVSIEESYDHFASRLSDLVRVHLV